MSHFPRFPFKIKNKHEKCDEKSSRRLTEETLWSIFSKHQKPAQKSAFWKTTLTFKTAIT